MKKCTNCGRQIDGPIHYCPFCGTLLPGEKEMTLVGEEDYSMIMKTSDCVEVDSKEWNEMVSFYQSHLTTGYAPKGKQLVYKSELVQLRKDNQEYEQAKRINGADLYGRLSCKVTQRRQKRINHVGFEDYWMKKIRHNKVYEWGSVALFYLLMMAYLLLVFCVLMVSIDSLGGWGLIVTVLIAALIIWGFRYIGKNLDFWVYNNYD